MVIEPVQAAKSKLEKLYDFDLMLDSGHLTGYAVNQEFENKIVEALRGLAKPETFASKYGIDSKSPVLLFAMGDGNHSLATAKAIWEKIKSKVGMDHPARYALVEIENVHDEGLEFEPIHRVLFGLKKSLFAQIDSVLGKNFEYTSVPSADEMVKIVDQTHGEKQAVGLVIGGKGFGVLEIAHPSSNLPVGAIQSFLDPYMKEGGAEKIDYVHGKDVVVKLGSQLGQRCHLSARHEQIRFVQDGDPGWCVAAQNFFNGRGAREKILYGSKKNFVTCPGRPLRSPFCLR